MLDWLAVGWNLAVTISGAFLVSLSFRRWPLDLDRRQALAHLGMTILTVLLIGAYPAAVVLQAPPYNVWADSFSDLRYVPLVTLMLAYRPVWALAAGLLTCLPQLALSLSSGHWGMTLAPLISTGLVLLVAAVQKRQLGILDFSLTVAARRLPLIFLPAGLPYLLGLGWIQGIIPALLLLGINLIGFLIGMTVLRSRFRLLAISARLSQQAHTDPLTGLWNRRQLEHDLSLLPADGHVFVIDLDYFKTINDRFGHDIGDEYLIAAAAAMNRALRAHASALPPSSPGLPVRDKRVWVRNESRTPYTEQAYRLGGEEFALLTGTSDPAQADALAQGILDQVRAVRHRADAEAQLTCSVGVAQRLDGETPQATLTRADRALMDAKANGRNRAERASRDAASPARTDTSIRPAQPLLWEAIHRSLELAALDRDLTTADWTQLLEAAILSVPGAEAGTINIRQDGHFELCAQVGFDDRLLGLSHSRTAQLDWYGLGEDAWTRGQPRMLLGTDIEARSARYAFPDENPADLFQTYGRIGALQSSLCIPVLMDADVVGHLNLDRISDHRPFDEEDLRIARSFADQVTVLTVASRRRAALERQRLEQAWLLDFSIGLLHLTDGVTVIESLLQGLQTLYGIHGRVVQDDEGLPPEALQAADRAVVDLGGPDRRTYRLALWAGQAFTAQDRLLFEQATRAVNAALLSLDTRARSAG